MKKVIILSSMLCLVISAEARAGVNVSLGLFDEPQPAYVEAPAYVGGPIYPTYGIEGGRYYRGHDHHDHRHDHHHR